jgi:hypothetical protein
MHAKDVRLKQTRPLEAESAGQAKVESFSRALLARAVLERSEQDLNGAGLVADLERFERERDRYSVRLLVAASR